MCLYIACATETGYAMDCTKQRSLDIFNLKWRQEIEDRKAASKVQEMADHKWALEIKASTDRKMEEIKAEVSPRTVQETCDFMKAEEAESDWYSLGGKEDIDFKED